MTAPEQASAWCHWLASRGVPLNQDEMRAMFTSGIESATKQANELLAAYRYAVGFYPDEYAIVCHSCHVGTGHSPNINEVMKCWNTRAQFAAASEDSRRLEWLEKRMGRTEIMDICDCDYEAAGNLRGAIQSAMAQQKGGG